MTFTATVRAISPITGTPSGTVQFAIDGSNYGSPVSLSGGTATVVDAALSMGHHTVTARYGGDGTFASSSGTLAGGQNVGLTGTTTEIASSAQPSVFGQNVTFTASVTPTSGTGTPTGIVQFMIDGSDYGSPLPLTGGSATIGDAALTLGSHTVAASYNGDDQFATSSGLLSGVQTVNRGTLATAVSSSVNPAALSQTVTFAATLTAIGPSAGTPGGTVQFVIDGTNYGSPVTLADGSASVTDSARHVGTHTVAVSYGGDSNFAASSGALAGGQTVNKASSSISVGSSQTNQTPALDFSGGFVNSSSKLTLNGTAGINVSRLELTNGSTFEAGSGFSTSPVDITKFKTQFTFQLSTATSAVDGLTFCIQSVGPTALGGTGGGLGHGPDPNSGPNHSHASIGSSMAIKFDLFNNSGEGNDSTGLYVNGVSPTSLASSYQGANESDLTSTGVNLQNGNVFQVDMTYNGTVLTVSVQDTVTNVSATQNYTIDIPGTIGATSAYAGFTGSTGSGTAVEDVLTWTYTPHTSAPSVFGQSVTFTTTIRAVSQGAGTPSGTVQFVIDGSNFGSAATLAGGSASVSAAALSVGTHTVAVSYSGDSNFITSSGTLAGGQTVQPRLLVTALTPTPTGFTAAFNKPVDPTKINVYDITLTGQVSNPGFEITGSVLLSNNNQTLTFAATNLELPDDTYSLDLTSSGNAAPPSGAAVGFQDLSGLPLDGANSAGTADYTTTFTTSYNSALTVLVPGFARGPGQPVNIKYVPWDVAYENGGNGIPVQLSLSAPSGSVAATTVSFSLNYNANLLTISNVANATSQAGGTYSVSTSGSGTNATATFSYVSSGSVTVTGGNDPITIGKLTATVPSGALYKAKGLLHVSPPQVQNGANPVPAVGQDGVQVVAFPGNASGTGAYQPLDASLMAAVGIAQQSGGNRALAAFPLADPLLIAALDGAIDPGSISQVMQALLNRAVPGIPAYTGAPSNNPSGPDPALAVGIGQWAVGSGQITVPVNIDDPHPAGSTGLMEATLALTYDPRAFSVSPQDIHLGTVPKAGTGSILAAPVLDPGKGQIGITLYSLTPISSASTGSLMTIDFHVIPGAASGASPIQLVAAVNAGGQEIETALADSQGFLTLHQALSSGFMPSLDGRVLVTTTLPDPVTGKRAEMSNRTLELPAERRPVLPAEDRDVMTGTVLAAEAEAAPAPAWVFLASLSAGTGFPIEGGPARPASVLPGMISPAPQRLLELVLGEPSYRWGTSIRRPELESVLWSSLQDGSDWLTDLDGGALRLPGGNRDEKPGGLPVPPAAPASTADDDGAWAEYLAETGEELG